ncbi:MAG: hypothetical protein JEY99_01935 [Spirochaetales bacterium]|nr:hypothetical protein [Spirochaetales bacterium]
MKQRISLILLFILLISFLSFGYDIEQVTFIPREFYIGDTVDMRVTLKIPSGTYLNIPEEFPRAGWIHIHDINFLENEEFTTIHIIFSSFQPGIRVLPPIDLGGLVLEGVRIDTASILDQEYSSFVSASDPMYLPGTAFYFGLLVGGLIGLPLFILFFFRVLRSRILRSVLTAGRRRPYIRLQKVLKELERKILNRDGNEFYTTLLLELKVYLSNRTGSDFNTLTSREACLILDDLYPEEFFRGTLEALFRFSDKVKFGGVDPYTARKKEDLNRLDEAVKALEIYYKHLWAAEDDKGVADVDR